MNKGIIRELSEKEQAIRRERLRFEREDAEEFQRKHRAHIGRCFDLGNGRYAIVTNVPQFEPTRTGLTFNQYQFPCFVLDATGDPNNDMVPFYEDTLYFRDSVGFVRNPMVKDEPYREISHDEFSAKFSQHIRTMIDRVFAHIQEAQ